jgi:hypothetical protein
MITAGFSKDGKEGKGYGQKSPLTDTAPFFRGLMAFRGLMGGGTKVVQAG